MVIHLFILVGYPTYRDKNLYFIKSILHFVEHHYPFQGQASLQGNIGHPCMALLQLGNVKHIMNPDSPSGDSNLLATSLIRSKTRYGPTNLGANFPLTPICLTPRGGDTRRHALSPIS